MSNRKAQYSTTAKFDIQSILFLILLNIATWPIVKQKVSWGHNQGCDVGVFQATPMLTPPENIVPDSNSTSTTAKQELLDPEKSNMMQPFSWFPILIVSKWVVRQYSTR